MTYCFEERKEGGAMKTEPVKDRPKFAMDFSSLFEEATCKSCGAKWSKPKGLKGAAPKSCPKCDPDFRIRH